MYQGGCSPITGRTKLEQFKKKLHNIFANLDVPLYVFAALGYDVHRKPNIGMWRALESRLSTVMPQQTVDMDASFFVGDAAGRPSSSTRPAKDFSDSDRKFALNVGLAFHTPQEFFLREVAAAHELSFDPKTYATADSPPFCYERKSELEVVVLVGSPAAGKSTFVETSLAPLGYERVNRE